MIDEKVISFDNNIRHRISYFKGIFSKQNEAEIVIEEWIKRFCDSWLKEEFQYYRGAEYYEHSRTDYDYANGYYHRRLITARGSILLKVPRGRKKRYRYSLFDRYKRYSRQFEDIVVESLLLGHSTRDARRFFDKVFGAGTISHSLASRILRRFDDEISQWKKREIKKPVAVLVVDAIHLKGVITGLKRARPVLFAYCIYKDGSEEVVDFAPVRSESLESYNSFLGRLYYRGLEEVELAVSDGHKGIKEAISMYWPRAKQQLCVFHFMQNFTKYLKGFESRRKRKIIKDAQWVYEAKDKGSFYGRLKGFMAKYRQIRFHKAFKYSYIY